MLLNCLCATKKCCGKILFDQNNELKFWTPILRSIFVYPFNPLSPEPPTPLMAIDRVKSIYQTLPGVNGLRHVFLCVYCRLYERYSFEMIPVMGHVIAGDWKSYQYLVESIRQFPNQVCWSAFYELITDYFSFFILTDHRGVQWHSQGISPPYPGKDPGCFLAAQANQKKFILPNTK